MRVLFVCTGNICRSPFAEYWARSVDDDAEFASAGTSAIESNPASATGITVAAELGVDMEAHRATRLTNEVLAGCDLVYAMESEHADVVLALDPSAEVELLSPAGAPIPDPYGGGAAEYGESYALIREAIESRFSDGR